MVYDKARRTEGGTGGFGVARKGEGREREGGRGRKPLATGRSKAQRREMHHLWLWSGSFAGAPPRPRASEREKENESVREGDMKREVERKVLTEAEGRPTYIRRPIPTQGEEDERRVKPSRVGLGQVYPSSTHTALSCVCHPAEENYTKAEAQPLREKRVAASFRFSRVASRKTLAIFRKEESGQAFAKRAS